MHLSNKEMVDHTSEIVNSVFNDNTISLEPNDSSSIESNLKKYNLIKIKRLNKKIIKNY